MGDIAVLGDVPWGPGLAVVWVRGIAAGLPCGGDAIDDDQAGLDNAQDDGV
jgi:hypothetical protein